METLRDVVRAAEAYAYHREYVTKTPELYQPLTLKRIRAGADVTTPAYIQGRRDLAQVRRTAEKWFDSVDVLVTPTLPIPPAAISDPHADDILPAGAQHFAVRRQRLARNFPPVRFHKPGPPDGLADHRPEWRRTSYLPARPCVRASNRLAQAPPAIARARIDRGLVAQASACGACAVLLNVRRTAQPRVAVLLKSNWMARS